MNSIDLWLSIWKIGYIVDLVDNYRVTLEAAAELIKMRIVHTVNVDVGVIDRKSPISSKE